MPTDTNNFHHHMVETLGYDPVKDHQFILSQWELFEEGHRGVLLHDDTCCALVNLGIWKMDDLPPYPGPTIRRIERPAKFNLDAFRYRPSLKERLKDMLEAWKNRKLPNIEDVWDDADYEF
jgi:hypothetical protein